MHAKSNLLGASLLVTGAAATAAAQQPPSYSVQWVAEAASVAALNEMGTVVGTQPLHPAAERAWVAGPNRSLLYLPLPPGRMSSRAQDINDLGVIVGAVGSDAYAEPSFGAVAAMWIPDGAGGFQAIELTKLPGDLGSMATALNDRGDVVGYSQGGMFRRAVWFNSATGLLDLTPTGAFDPRDINEQRVVVCYSTHCSRLDLDTMVLEDLGVPPGSYVNTLGLAIKEANQVAGSAVIATSTDCDRQAARYTDGVGWEVFGGCGKHNGAGSLNELGDITMWQNVASFVRLEELGLHATEGLIDAPIGHWYTGVLATGLINSSREIAIYAHNSQLGVAGIVLLRPITYVGTGICAGDGLTAACPCGNQSGIGEHDGCLNSSGAGARLLGTGSASIAADDLVLRVSQAAAHQTALLFQGGPGNAIPFFDGLRCASGPIVRLEALTLDGSGGGGSTISVATRGHVAPGLTQVYQAWFRDPLGPCGTLANTSAGLQITWSL